MDAAVITETIPEYHINPPGNQLSQPKTVIGIPFTREAAEQARLKGLEIRRNPPGSVGARVKVTNRQIDGIDRLLKLACDGRLITDYDKDGEYVFASAKDVAALVKARKDQFEILFTLTGHERPGVRKSVSRRQPSSLEPTAPIPPIEPIA